MIQENNVDKNLGKYLDSLHDENKLKTKINCHNKLTSMINEESDEKTLDILKEKNKNIEAELLLLM